MTSEDAGENGARLNFVAMGPEEAEETVLFLHGFAGDLIGWTNLQVGLAGSMRSIAFDLPGHGGSLQYPETCNAVVAAKAVIKEIEALGMDKVHLVGHSMGGAAAAILALKRPDLVKSLCLLSPGGFGVEINQALLRRYAVAEDVNAISILLEQFFGPAFRMPRALADHVASYRRQPDALAALGKTVDAILDGTGQKRLPLEEIAALPFPLKILWGRKDRVIPVSQVYELPEMFGVHLFGDAGHMVHLERPRATLALIRQNVRAGR
ncbi:alpha/beta fold hydrolase [uncultured Cohaesibacter sp.]|uniref:alpha/beta fold hydrolase n=1 Tax=uncultured Cohaesibacter sp. TaxID=1002546 RepID=UPI002931C9F3|nr:alpha/beta fold hydrolase [uncultured Cohaesibacter sp.]